MLRKCKSVSLILALALSVSALGGCGNNATANSTATPTPAAATPTPAPAVISATPSLPQPGEIVDGVYVLRDAPENPYPYVYRYTTSAVTTLNPHTYSSTDEGNFIGYFNEGLLGAVYLEELGNWTFVPIMAANYPESNADRTVWTYTLRDELQFADGKPIDAHTFIESYKLLLDPKLTNRNASSLFQSVPVVNAEAYYKGEIEDWEEVGLKALDAKTLQFTLNEPMPAIDFYNSTSGGYSLGVVDVELYKSLMNEDGTATLYGTDVDKMNSNGAYVIEEMNKDQYAIFERNPKSFLQRYRTVDRLEFRVNQEISVALQLFENDEIDLVSASGENYLKYQDDPRLTPNIGSTVWGLFVNTDPEKVKNPVLLDLDFRKALNYATPREDIAKGVFYTYIPANYMVADTAVVGDILGGNSIKYRDTPQGKSREAATPLFDAELAKQHFDLAYEANGSVPIKIELIYFDGQSTMKKTAETVQETWETIFGRDKFTLEIVSVPSSQAYSFYGEHNYDLGIGARTQNSINPWSSMRPWISTYTPTAKYDSFYNEEFDELYKSTVLGGALVEDPEARLEALAKMEGLLMDYIPFIPIFQNFNYYMIADRMDLVAGGYVPAFGYGQLQSDFTEIK